MPCHFSAWCFHDNAPFSSICPLHSCHFQWNNTWKQHWNICSALSLSGKTLIKLSTTQSVRLTWLLTRPNPKRFPSDVTTTGTKTHDSCYWTTNILSVFNNILAKLLSVCGAHWAPCWKATVYPAVVFFFFPTVTTCFCQSKFKVTWIQTDHSCCSPKETTANFEMPPFKSTKTPSLIEKYKKSKKNVIEITKLLSRGSCAGFPVLMSNQFGWLIRISRTFSSPVSLYYTIH